MRMYLSFATVFFVVRAFGGVGDVVSTASFEMTLMDTTVATNDVVMARYQQSLPVEYSSTSWDETGSGEAVAVISYNNVNVYESKGDGTFEWAPSQAGRHLLRHSNGHFTVEKYVNVIAPTVLVARDENKLCVLTASDGESAIHYTTDGSEPNEKSALYQGPFEVAASELTYVRACTFGDGYFKGQTAMAVFDAPHARVDSQCCIGTIDTECDVKTIGYGGEKIVYDAYWHGDVQSFVCVTNENGESIYDPHVGASGQFDWVPTFPGRQSIYHKTFDPLGNLEGVYTAKYDVVSRNVVITNGLIPYVVQSPIGAEWITNAVIAANVRSLGEGLFANCTRLERIWVGDSITNIGENVFAGCTNFVGVEFVGERDVVVTNGALPYAQQSLVGSWWITNAVVSSEVKFLCDGFFAGCGRLERVIVGDSVTNIGVNVFAGCSNIVDVTLGAIGSGTSFTWQSNDWSKNADGVWQSKSIGDNQSSSMIGIVAGSGDLTFEWNVSSENYCDKLTYYEDGNQIGQISGTGGDWNSITRHFADGEHRVEWRYSKDGSVSKGCDCGWVRNLKVPSGNKLSDIFPDCYWKLRKVVIGENVKELPSGFFDGCDTLDDIQLPQDIRTDYCDAEGWVVWKNQRYAFVQKDITNLVFKSHWTNVCAGAFAGCRKLTDITFEVVPEVIGVTNNWLSAMFPSSTGVVQSVTFDARVKTLPPRFFSEFTNIRKVVGLPLCEGVLSDIGITLEEVVFVDGNISRLPDNFFAGCGHLKSFTIPDSIIAIGTNVFESACDLKTVVTNSCRIYQGWIIGYEGVSASVDIPSGIRGIAANVFKGHDEIETVRFPAGFRFIGANAFELCTRLEDVDLSDGVLEVDRRAFNKCTGVNKITLSSSLKVIGASAFENCTSAAGVVCPAGLMDIGEGAFSNCWHMMSVSLPNSLTNIGVNAFADCDNITGVTVPTHIKPLCELFPKSYAEIASAKIADGATTLVPMIFSGCCSLEEVQLPESVADIPYAAFNGCSALKYIVFPIGVTNIAAQAFEGCTTIYRLEFPTGLKHIGESSFAELPLLQNIVLPENIEFVGDNAFASCPSVRSITIRGDVAPVADILPDAYSELTAATLTTNSTRICDRCLAGCESLQNVDIPSQVTDIGASAFQGCASMNTLTLPYGLRRIGAHAFDGMDELLQITLPFGVEEVGVSAFANCTKIRSVTVNGSLASLQDLFPDSYAALTEVTVWENSDSLVDRFCEGCSSLMEIGIPAGVHSLGRAAFKDCTNLLRLSLPQGLTEIEDDTFAGCASLKSLTIPESVTRLGANIFDGCTLLKSVNYLGNAPTYDVNAYWGVESDLVSYIVNGTCGWDGIKTSQALPRSWPNGYENGITYWTPNRFVVEFDACGGTVEETELEQITGTTYILPQPDPVRNGAVFKGWWTEIESGAQIKPTKQVILTSSHTLYAHWKFNQYSIRFDANGGQGEMSPLPMTVEVEANLTPSRFGWIDHDFVGWATTPDGEVVFADGQSVSDLTYVDGEVVVLYAVWNERKWTYANYLNATNLSFVTYGDVLWQPEVSNGYDKVSCMRSVMLEPAAQEGETVTSTIQTMVTGEGVGSFWWSVDCEPDDGFGEYYDYVVFEIDGVEKVKIANTPDWQKVEYQVSGGGVHTLTWVFCRDDYDESDADYENVARLDCVTWTPNDIHISYSAGGATGDVPDSMILHAGDEFVLPTASGLAHGGWSFKGWNDGTTLFSPGDVYVVGINDVVLTAIWEEKNWTLEESLNVTNLTFSTGGDASWRVDVVTNHDGAASARSGEISHSQESWISATVTGAGVLSFWVKAAGEIYRGKMADLMRFDLDGTSTYSIAVSDWTNVTINVVGSGSHTMKWTYLKNASRDAEYDCVWIDQVEWSPVPVVDPIPEIEEDATPEMVAAALNGSTDNKLAENITNATEYANYRDWAASVKTPDGTSLAGFQMVKDSDNTWLSFALHTDTLIATAPVQGDLRIDAFEPGMVAGSFELTVSLDGVEIGSEASKENLKKVFGIEGATSLSDVLFSSANVDLEFDTPVGGKVKCTAVPKDKDAKSFFIKMRMK